MCIRDRCDLHAKHCFIDNIFAIPSHIEFYSQGGNRGEHIVYSAFLDDNMMIKTSLGDFLNFIIDIV